jgi:hypothetical protein
MKPESEAQFVVGAIQWAIVTALRAALDIKASIYTDRHTMRQSKRRLPQADALIQVDTDRGLFWVLIHARENEPSAPRVQIMDPQGGTSTYFVDKKEDTWRPDPDQVAKTLTYKMKAYAGG